MFCVLCFCDNGGVFKPQAAPGAAFSAAGFAAVPSLGLEIMPSASLGSNQVDFGGISIFRAADAADKLNTFVAAQVGYAENLV